MELGGAQLKEAVLDLIAKLKEEWDVQIVRRQVYTEEEVKEKDMTIERLTQDLDEVFATLGELCKITFDSTDFISTLTFSYPFFFFLSAFRKSSG